MKKHFAVDFIRSGRGKARCAPNPNFPNGKSLVDPNSFGCVVDLPYPAPECGIWAVTCLSCGLKVAVTCAGRADDPTRFQINCKARAFA